MALTADVVASKYIALRDKISELKREHEAAIKPYAEAMDKCESWLLVQLNALGGDNITIRNVGTVMRGRKMQVAGKDWKAFNEFAAANNQMDMFERRISRTVLAAYMKDHNDMIPPGLDVSFEQTVTVRRATTKGESE